MVCGKPLLVTISLLVIASFSPTVFSYLRSLAEDDKSGASASEPDTSTVTVHFVPHSHLDAGWLKTYDDYYKESVRLIYQ